MKQEPFLDFFLKFKNVEMTDQVLNKVAFEKKLSKFSTNMVSHEDCDFEYNIDIKNTGDLHIIQNVWTKTNKCKVHVKAFFINCFINSKMNTNTFENTYTFD